MPMLTVVTSVLPSRSTGSAIAARSRSATCIASLGSCEVGQDGGELVAAEAGHAVGRAQRLLQPLPDHLQQPVADLVPEVVVDGLEAVEVEVEHREVRLVTADARQRGLEAVEQQHPVRAGR